MAIPMNEIIEFNQIELKIIQDAVDERYGASTTLEIGEAEIRPDSASRSLMSVAVVHWSHEDVNFVIFKLADRHYRSQFFYRGYQQFGTGHEMYDDIGECVITTLQVQADHAASEARKNEPR